MKSLRCAIVAVGLATTQTAASGQAPQSVAPSRLPPQASGTFSDPGAYPPDVNENYGDVPPAPATQEP